MVKISSISLLSLVLFSFSATKSKDVETRIEAKKDKTQELLELGRRACRDKDIRKAIIYYQKLIGIAPNNIDAWTELGGIRYQEEDYKEALHCYRKALALNPDSATLHHNVGLCLKRQDCIDEANQSFEQAIKLQPTSVRSYLNYALLLKKQGKIEDAIEILQKGLAIIPCDVDLHRVLGSLYREQNKFDLATTEFREAASLAPDDVNILTELANTLCMQEQLDEALEIYRNAFELDTSLNNVLYNIGFVLKRKGFINQAIEVLNKVIEREPENGQAHFSLGLSYLTRGLTEEDWHNGWLEYEWRWTAYKERRPHYKNKPFWQGQELRGKTLLLIGEQGLGDTFEFIRYARLLKERGARIIFLAQRPLKPFIKIACNYLDEVVIPGDPLPDFDYQVALMSLPLIFKTTEKTISSEVPYLQADSSLVTYWQDCLAADDKFKIGLCWQGNANYRTQALQQVVAAKSFDINNLAPLADIPGCSFYSLQKINGTDQLKDLQGDLAIIDFGNELDEEHGRFMDTAAIIMNLNLVITADTSIAHLAAALGVKTWILLPTPCDWRWMLKREDTPWYPNIRLFRQTISGSWDGAIANVADALRELVAKNQQIEVINDEPVATENIPSKSTTSEEIGDHTISEQARQILSLPAPDFLDKVTLLALREGDITSNESITDFDRAELVRNYQLYGTTYPQIKSLAQGLYAANCYLIDGLNSLHAQENSIDNKIAEETIKLVYRAYKIKRLIKDDIAAIVQKSH